MSYQSINPHNGELVKSFEEHTDQQLETAIAMGRAALVAPQVNGSRALRIDVGFLREHCSNGVIFEQEAATLTVPHTRQGIHSLKVARPFAGMSALREEFSKTLAAVRAVAITLADATQLVRQVTGWPQLPEKPKPWESDEQAKQQQKLAE